MIICGQNTTILVGGPWELIISTTCFDKYYINANNNNNQQKNGENAIHKNSEDNEISLTHANNMKRVIWTKL